MKKVILSIILFLLLIPSSVFAQQRNSEGYIVWRVPNTCPRKPGGIWSISEHKRWIQSIAGQNDLVAAGLPDKIRKLAVKLTQEQYDAYGKEVIFPTGEKGIIKDITAFKGTKYYHLSFGNGQMLSNVLLGFDSYVYRTEITDNYNIKWIIDTHKICGNQGEYKVNIITPQLPPSLPPVTEEVVRYYYQEERVFVPEYQYAKEKSVQFKGIWDGLSRILAQVWRKPDNINMIANGGTFTGGSWTQSNFNNQSPAFTNNPTFTQGQGQGQGNYNYNNNSPTYNNTNSSNNSNTINSVIQDNNTQNTNNTIEVVP